MPTLYYIGVDDENSIQISHLCARIVDDSTGLHWSGSSGYNSKIYDLFTLALPNEYDSQVFTDVAHAGISNYS